MFDDSILLTFLGLSQPWQTYSEEVSRKVLNKIIPLLVQYKFIRNIGG